jgi:hypothetical protein
MANQPFVSGQATVGATATLLASPTGPGGITVQASVTGIYVGGSTVTTSNGFELPTATPITIPTQGPVHDLWVVGATGTVSFIYPAGN